MHCVLKQDRNQSKKSSIKTITSGIIDREMLVLTEPRWSSLYRSFEITK